MDSERFFSTLASETGPVPESDRAPARLKSRIYSRLIAEQAATGRLLNMSETQQAGRSLCVFEAVVAHAPLPESVKSLNPCSVCHARQLAEHMDHAPIFWRHCPYSEFHRG